MLATILNFSGPRRKANEPKLVAPPIHAILPELSQSVIDHFNNAKPVNEGMMTYDHPDVGFSHITNSAQVDDYMGVLEDRTTVYNKTKADYISGKISREEASKKLDVLDNDMCIYSKNIAQLTDGNEVLSLISTEIDYELRKQASMFDADAQRELKIAGDALESAKHLPEESLLRETLEERSNFYVRSAIISSDVSRSLMGMANYSINK